jgi:hypothetical protein
MATDLNVTSQLPVAQLEGLVVAATDNAVAVGADGDGGHSAAVALQLCLTARGSCRRCC